MKTQVQNKNHIAVKCNVSVISSSATSVLSTVSEPLKFAVYEHRGSQQPYCLGVYKNCVKTGAKISIFSSDIFVLRFLWAVNE